MRILSLCLSAELHLGSLLVSCILFSIILPPTVAAERDILRVYNRPTIRGLSSGRITQGGRNRYGERPRIPMRDSK